MASQMNPYKKCLSIYNTMHWFAAFVLLVCVCTTVQASDSSFKITSPISGVIDKVHVEVGQSVKKGQLLLEYDTSLIDSNLAAAEAKVHAAKLNLEEAKKENERAQELYDRTVLSDHELQKAKIDYAKARAQFAKAKNLQVHSLWDKSHSKLLAPFSGTVRKLFSYSGQYVNNEISAETLMVLERAQ